MVDYVNRDDLSDKDSIAHFALFIYCDPITFEKVINDEKWQKAMNGEIQSIEKNDIWQLSYLAEGQNSNDVKWVYKKN